MRIIGNLIRLVFGGVVIAIEFLIDSIVMMITIEGIPFGRDIIKI